MTLSERLQDDPWLFRIASRAEGALDSAGPAERRKAINTEIVSLTYEKAEQIARAVVKPLPGKNRDLTLRLDDLLTSRWFGLPIMLLGLGLIFWMTIVGANVPGEYLSVALFWIGDQLSRLFQWAGAPDWLHGFLVEGVYRGMAWVVSVMLPPMAIFFPIFTLLEDAGYLPRVAFNMDRLFKAAGAHGKQALTMAMGFGCNAAAIVSTRIIESPRERMIAILTNNFVPCNGRWPILITLSILFVGGAVAAGWGTAASTAVVVGFVLIGVMVTLAVSWGLSRTMLKGIPSSFTLELPPYRRPQVGRTIIRSIHDRTLYVLWRAVRMAAPAGAITWLMANITVDGTSLLAMTAGWLDPFGRSLGMDGMILLAFILGLPANEIVLPILIMGYVSAGTMIELDSLAALKHLLVDQHGWTWVTALNVMLFSLLHYPCGTTLQVIYGETKSIKWTAVAALLPLSIAVGVTFTVNQLVQWMGWV